MLSECYRHSDDCELIVSLCCSTRISRTLRTKSDDCSAPTMKLST